MQERIARACDRVGRKPESVKLVAVTKTVESAKIKEAISAGISIVGENRVQEAWQKYQEVDCKAEWHMIGHLQTNKVRKALQFVSAVQSVDSVKLAREIQVQANKLDRRVDIFMEVNTSAEASKYGFHPEESLAAAREISAMDNLSLVGLMTIGAFTDDPAIIRACFQLLRRQGRMLEDTGLVQHELELSMGMTNDFEIAIEEGTTMVRVGRLIFGERNPERVDA